LGRTPQAITLGLRRQIRPYVPKEPVDIAVDFTDRPYYGAPHDPRRRQYVRTKEECGAHRAHRFVSLSILLPRVRLIGSLGFHPSNGGTLRAVRKGLHVEQVRERLKAVFLDRGFYNYAVLSWPKAQGMTSVVKLLLGSQRRKKWEDDPRSYTTTHTMRGPRPEDPSLTLTIHVVVRYRDTRWGERGNPTGASTSSTRSWAT
jgi:hypothetical protein